jgi:hypothetical protein
MPVPVVLGLRHQYPAGRPRGRSLLRRIHYKVSRRTRQPTSRRSERCCRDRLAYDDSRRAPVNDFSAAAARLLPARSHRARAGDRHHPAPAVLTTAADACASYFLTNRASASDGRIRWSVLAAPDADAGRDADGRATGAQTTSVRITSPLGRTGAGSSVSSPRCRRRSRAVSPVHFVDARSATTRRPALRRRVRDANPLRSLRSAWTPRTARAASPRR